MINALKFCFVVASSLSVLFLPREVAALFMWGAWTIGLWWGYREAQGEVKQ